MFYDITPELSESYPVWPGEQSLKKEIVSTIGQKSSVTSSNIHLSVHLGAHADAPSHYDKDGETIEMRDLHYYLGPCQVIRVPTEKNKAIFIRDIKDLILAERVLIATDSYAQGEPISEGFAFLTPELIDLFHHKGVITLGIDTPSIDSFDAKDLSCHRALSKNDMAILENLDLSNVSEGLYELIALPLKLKGFDASPVRAILRTLHPG